MTVTIRAVQAGTRVVLTSCDECFAAILIDPSDEFDAVQAHELWHEAARYIR